MMGQRHYDGRSEFHARVKGLMSGRGQSATINFTDQKTFGARYCARKESMSRSPTISSWKWRAKVVKITGGVSTNRKHTEQMGAHAKGQREHLADGETESFADAGDKSTD